jgi:deazaflavin-dependent oxidoreductase (nitroreductase family)
MTQNTRNARLQHGILRFFLRLPLWLYRAHLGWLLGERFLLLTHTGRKSGQPHQTMLEVVRYDKLSDSYIIASGWGEQSDWLRNLKQTPQVTVQVGRRCMAATAERLSPPDAEHELRDYARRHPTAFRKLARLMTGQPWRDEPAYFLQLARSVPLIALRRNTKL